MKENTRNLLLAAGVVALLAFAALAYHLYPGIITRLGIERDELGAGMLVVLVLWLVLRKQKPMSQQMRLVLGVAVAAGMLVGLAVFFIS